MISPKKNKNNQPQPTPKFESDHLYSTYMCPFLNKAKRDFT